MVSWAFAPIGVHRPSLRLPYLIFSIRFFCHRISIVFLLYGQRIATHSVDPSLTQFLGEFQAWDWLWYPMLWTQRRNSGAHGAENSIQISALAGVEPRTPPFSRLLRHAEGYSRTILTPNLQINYHNRNQLSVRLSTVLRVH